MVVYTASKKLTHLISPSLLKWGLAARNGILGLRGGTNPPQHTPYLDAACGIPLAQKLLSLTIYDLSAAAVARHRRSAAARSVEKALDTTYDALFGLGANSVDTDESSTGENKQQKSLANLRVEVLEETLRPILLPNELWEDVERWRDYPRLLAWVRREFLIAKHGPSVKEALDAYPQLRNAAQLGRHPTQRFLLNLARGRLDLLPGVATTNTAESEDDLKRSSRRRTGRGGGTLLLPSTETLIKAFRLRKWASTKDTQRVRQSMVPIARRLGGDVLRFRGEGEEKEEKLLLSRAEIPSKADLSKISFEDVLEVAGGQIQHHGAWNTVCEEADIYQMWTQEYVRVLGDYLWDRTQAHASNHGGETVVVDMGAGDGLLIHFLQEHMELLHDSARRNTPGRTQSKAKISAASMPTLVATDDGSWRIFPKADVEKLSIHDTLAKYAPAESNGKNKRQVILLCSWMPMGQDWTNLFRECAVDEYILIGESDDGSCGHNWSTWGNPNFRWHPSDLNEDDSNNTPPYRRDGYKRTNMEGLSRYQLSRFDCAVSRSSTTVSFRHNQRRHFSANKTPPPAAARIHVIVVKEVPPERQDEWLDMAEELSIATLSEPGCISYDFIRSSTNENRFLIVEEWESQPYLDAHFETAHFRKMVPLMDGMSTTLELDIGVTALGTNSK